ncbi:MAG: hypothetical protein ACT4PW_01505 [Acidimicrobiia bacterium]
MLFPRRFWAGLEAGTATVAYRRWRRPTVKAGGQLRSPGGPLAIDSVAVVEADGIDESEARRAGYPTVSELLADLAPEAEDRLLYRIEFHPAGPDPRTVLAQDDDLDAAALDAVARRLARLDRAAPEPWTLAVLALIDRQPGVAARDLATGRDVERDRFKRDVRVLKGLGLTESLVQGYRLSPRGQAVLAALR